LLIDLLLWVGFEGTLEIGEGSQRHALVLVDPAIGDLVNRDGIEEVKLVTATLAGGNEVGFLKDAEVFGDSLAAHIVVGAKLVERLTVAAKEAVEKLSPAGVCESFED
jgi:hypothetical protein